MRRKNGRLHKLTACRILGVKTGASRRKREGWHLSESHKHFGIHRSKSDKAHEIMDTIGQVEAKWGLGQLQQSQVLLFSKPSHISSSSNNGVLRHLSMTCESMSSRRFSKGIFKNFLFRSPLPQKITSNFKGSFTLASLHTRGCTVGNSSLHGGGGFTL